MSAVALTTALEIDAALSCGAATTGIACAAATAAAAAAAAAVMASAAVASADTKCCRSVWLSCSSRCILSSAI